MNHSETWIVNFDPNIYQVDNNRPAKVLLFNDIGKRLKTFFKKSPKHFVVSRKRYTFASHLRKTNAQMAESVDALVSNTSGATHPGSIPGLGTTEKVEKLSPFSFLYIPPTNSKLHLHTRDNVPATASIKSMPNRTKSSYYIL